MNSTCIHLRAEDPNMYMYRRREYTKNPRRNTIIEKAKIFHFYQISMCVVLLHQWAYQITQIEIPGQGSSYTMVVVVSLVPIRLHQNCRYQTSHWMVHLEALLVPSIQAKI
jgi:hypothetical protein